MDTRNTPRRAAIYARISSDPADQRAGVDRQIDDCRTLAERQGWTIIAEHIDNDVSAWSGTQRPAYRALLADMRGGRVDTVIVWHVDRLARRIRDLVGYLEAAESANVETVTVTSGSIDISSAAGKFNVHMLASIAEYESAHRSERIKRAARQRALDGRHSGGKRCYGYELDGYTINDSEAAEVRGMVAAILRGESLRSIVADLNARGCTTAYGRKWTSVAVRTLVTAPTIAGLSSHHGEIVGKGTWPAIVSEAEFHAVAAILADPKRRTNNRGNAVRYLGSGLYLCGVCGSNDVRVSHTNDGRHRYRCRNRVKGDPATHVGRDQPKLDEYVEAVIVERLARADVAAEVGKRSATTVDIAALTAQRHALAERKDQLVELFTDGAISAGQLARGNAKLDADIAGLDATLASVAEESPLVGVAGRDDIAELWQRLSLGRKRAILDALVTVTIMPTKSGRTKDGVYFRHEDIRFDWK